MRAELVDGTKFVESIWWSKFSIQRKSPWKQPL